MNSIKNFIYNISDILVALLIILAATLIIGWRVNAIMDYPGTVAAQAETEASQTADTDADAEKDAPGADAGAADADTDPSSGTSGGSESGTPAPPAAPVTVDIPAGSTVPGIADALCSAGALSDPQQFIDAVNRADAATKLKYGTYKIPPGTSADQIVQMML